MVLPCLGSSDSLPAAKGKGRTARARRKARAVLDRPPLQGWRTTDEDEVACAAGAAAPRSSLSSRSSLSNRFSARSACAPLAVAVYEVEIRSFESFTNSCGCLDHRVNGLGTCKHIEGVLAALRQGGGRSVPRGGRLEAVRASRYSLTAAVAPRLR